MANVHESLTHSIPGQGDQPAKVEPLLAEKWDIAVDGLTWAFHLRQGVKFHDGADLTADAVNAAIERTVKIASGASVIWSSVTAIEALDAATVVMKLSAPQPLDMIAASGFAAWIVSPSVLDKDNTWFNASNGCGTGPYQMERYEPGQRCILGRNKSYWGKVPEGGFDKEVFVVVEDPVLSRTMIESGDSDWTYGLPYDSLEGLKARREVTVMTNPALQIRFGRYNVRKAPLDNPKVRKALSLALPYDDVILSCTAGFGSRAKGVIPAGIWGQDDAAPIPNTDLDAAHALLAGARVTSANLTMTYSTGDSLESVAGELWKANLATLGINLTLQPFAWDAQWQLAKSDPAAAQDIFVMYWWPTYITPYDHLFNLFHSEPWPNYNLGYYANADFDKLIDDAANRAGTDITKAEAMFIQA